MKKAIIKHGLKKSGAYVSWSNMKSRCLNPNHEDYRLYGGRGIKVCERWKSFIKFYADMGDRPERHTIDRLDPDGDYAPGNCRWATRKQQTESYRPNHQYFGMPPRWITFEGKTVRRTEWARQTGIHRDTIA